ncbi:hypothetical protein HV406_17370 [Bacillus sporothermodurans]|nr:hypothetical protein [Heyndrickxia sporothermodurans]
MVENIVTRIMMMTFLFTQLYGLNRNTYGYGSGKKKSGPMEKEHVWLWVRKEKNGPMEKEHVCLWGWKEEKRSDGKGTCMAMGPVRGVAVRWAGRMGSNGNA